jgi:hypothetical protein
MSEQLLIFKNANVGLKLDFRSRTEYEQIHNYASYKFGRTFLELD